VQLLFVGADEGDGVCSSRGLPQLGTAKQQLQLQQQQQQAGNRRGTARSVVGEAAGLARRTPAAQRGEQLPLSVLFRSVGHCGEGCGRPRSGRGAGRASVAPEAGLARRGPAPGREYEQQSKEKNGWLPAGAKGPRSGERAGRAIVAQASGLRGNRLAQLQGNAVRSADDAHDGGGDAGPAARVQVAVRPRRGRRRHQGEQVRRHAHVLGVPEGPPVGVQVALQKRRSPRSDELEEIGRCPERSLQPR
jgi:hypothetical protein